MRSGQAVFVLIVSGLLFLGARQLAEQWGRVLGSQNARFIGAMTWLIRGAAVGGGLFGAVLLVIGQ